LSVFFIDKAGKQKYHKAALQNYAEKHSYCGYYRMVIITTLEGFMKSFVRKVIFLGLVIVSITMVTSCKQEIETAVEEIQLTE